MGPRVRYSREVPTAVITVKESNLSVFHLRKHERCCLGSVIVFRRACTRLSSAPVDNNNQYFQKCVAVSLLLADSFPLDIHFAATSNGPNNLPVFLTVDSFLEDNFLIVCADASCSSFNKTDLGGTFASDGRTRNALQMPNGRALFFFKHSSYVTKRLYCTSDDCSTFEIAEFDGFRIHDGFTCDVGSDGNAWCFSDLYVCIPVIF